MPVLAAKAEISYQKPAIVQDHDLREELKPLWVACYFERRLSKYQIQAVDLKHTMRAVQELLTERDFREVYPFVFGLVKILARKFNFLISESNTTLDSLKNPFAEDEVEVVGSKVRRAAPKRDGAYAKARKNFIDLSNVKYHGLDQAVFARIE